MNALGQRKPFESTESNIHVGGVSPFGDATRLDTEVAMFLLQHFPPGQPFCQMFHSVSCHLAMSPVASTLETVMGQARSHQKPKCLGLSGTPEGIDLMEAPLIDTTNRRTPF